MAITHVSGICLRTAPDKGTEILLAQRAFTRKSYPGFWEVSGGTIEPGERLETTLMRELREEIGVLAVPRQMVTRYDLFIPKPAPRTISGCLFLCDITGYSYGMRPVADAEDTIDVRWFHMDALDTIDLIPGIPAYIPQAVRLYERINVMIG